MNEAIDRWETQVRDYEVDYQGIVNNAVYMHYLDNARALYLEKLGIDIRKYAADGINIVLINAELKYKKSLSYPDAFYVKTVLTRISRFKFLFTQNIYLTQNNLEILTAKNLVCCFNSKLQKPCVIEKLDTHCVIV